MNNDYHGYNFADEGMTHNDNDQTNGKHHEENSTDDNEFLLNTYLKHAQWTPSDPPSNPLSFSHSHHLSRSKSIPDLPPFKEENDNKVNKPLLNTYLSHSQWTPSDLSLNPLLSPHSLSRSHSNPISAHIKQRPRIDDNHNDSNQQRVHQQFVVNHGHSHFYPTPRDSTNSSSPITSKKLQNWLKKHGLDSIYNKLIQAGLNDMYVAFCFSET